MILLINVTLLSPRSSMLPLSYIILLDCLIHEAPPNLITHPKLQNPNVFVHNLACFHRVGLYDLHDLSPGLIFKSLNQSLRRFYFSFKFF